MQILLVNRESNLFCCTKYELIITKYLLKKQKKCFKVQKKLTLQNNKLAINSVRFFLLMRFLRAPYFANNKLYEHHSSCKNHLSFEHSVHTTTLYSSSILDILS